MRRPNSRPMRLLCLWTVLWAAALATNASLAQDTGPGRVSARSFATLPTPIAVVVAPTDNTDENEALARRFGEALAARGVHVVAQGAPLVFYFDSEVRANVRGGGEGTDPGRAAIETEDPADRGLIKRDTPDPARSPGAGRDRLLGGRGGDQAYYGRALRYVINATIDDARDGRRLWQGHVSYDGAETDRLGTLAAIVPFLVAEVGKTVQQRRFRLD